MSSPASRHVSQLSISELELEITRYESLLSQHQRSVTDTRNQLSLLRGELDRRARGALEPRLSDHAVIRFLERFLGIDVGAVRARILSDTVKASIKAGATAVVVDGVRLKVQDNVIVTVLDSAADARFKKIKRDRLKDEPSVEDGLADYFEGLAREAVQ